MYDQIFYNFCVIIVTGPCEFLVMYDIWNGNRIRNIVTGPCEFLVMYDIYEEIVEEQPLQDPVNF